MEHCISKIQGAFLLWKPFHLTVSCWFSPLPELCSLDECGLELCVLIFSSVSWLANYLLLWVPVHSFFFCLSCWHLLLTFPIGPFADLSCPDVSSLNSLESLPWGPLPDQGVYCPLAYCTVCHVELNCFRASGDSHPTLTTVFFST